MTWQGMQVDLQLLPQPFYIYEIDDKESPVVDGALFAYATVNGADPEVLLVLEAQRTGVEFAGIMPP